MALDDDDITPTREKLSSIRAESVDHNGNSDHRYEPTTRELMDAIKGSYAIANEAKVGFEKTTEALNQNTEALGTLIREVATLGKRFSQHLSSHGHGTAPPMTPPPVVPGPMREKFDSWSDLPSHDEIVNGSPKKVFTASREELELFFRGMHAKLKKEEADVRDGVPVRFVRNSLMPKVGWAVVLGSVGVLLQKLWEKLMVNSHR